MIVYFMTSKKKKKEDTGKFIIKTVLNNQK